MPSDINLIPQEKVDTTNSLLVDAHSLMSLPYTQDYESTLLVDVNRMNLALANLIQNIVLYDTILADSLLLQTEPAVKMSLDLFPGIIKGVFFEKNLRRDIGERVTRVVGIWDKIRTPKVITTKHWDDIKNLESEAKGFMDKMTKVVPNLVPPEFEEDEERIQELKMVELRASVNPRGFENLPVCCVESTTGLARTHYYLELSRELSIPLSVHPIRSKYLESLISEYKVARLKDNKSLEEDTKIDNLEKVNKIDKDIIPHKSRQNSSQNKSFFQKISNRIFGLKQDNISSTDISERERQIDDFFDLASEAYEKSKERSAIEEIVAYAEDIILEDVIKGENPISINLEIPAISEMVAKLSSEKECPIHEAVIEVRQSRNAIKFREWCQIYNKAMAGGRSGSKEVSELRKELQNACEIWRDNIKEEVDYKTRTISLEKIPIAGGILKSLNMDKLNVRDKILVPKKNISYFLLLNDLYHP